MKAELEALVRGNPHIWRANAPHPEQDLAVDSGIDKLNDFLPAGGWPAGSVVELLVDDWGIGELQILLPLMTRFSQQCRRLTMIAPPYLPYAPALLSAGVRLDHLVIIDNRIAPEDIWWAAEKTLRHESGGLVLTWPGLPDYRQVRRLQLAASAGNNLGMLLHRGPAVDAPVALRLKLWPTDQGLGVRILKSRFSWQRDDTLVIPLP